MSDMELLGSIEKFNIDKVYNLTLTEFLNLSESKKSLINVDDIGLTINNKNEIDYLFKFIVRNLDEYEISVYDKKNIPCYRVHKENEESYFELEYYPLEIVLDIRSRLYTLHEDDWEVFGMRERYSIETEDKFSIDLEDMVYLILNGIEASGNKRDRLTQLIVDELYNSVYKERR